MREDLIPPETLVGVESKEKEEWRTEFRRITIVRKRVPKLLTQQEFEEYTRLYEEKRRRLR